VSERSAVIKGRCFGPVVLTERTVTIPERKLDGPVHLVQRAITIPERKLSGPVHIVGHAFEVPPEDIEFSDYYADKGPMNTILVGWTTNVPTIRYVKWRVKDSSDEWSLSGWTNSYVLTAGKTTLMQATPGNEYEFYNASKTEGGYGEWDYTLRYITVDEEGEPEDPIAAGD